MRQGPVIATLCAGPRLPLVARAPRSSIARVARARAEPVADRPNVLLIVADDQPTGMTNADAEPRPRPRVRQVQLLLRQQSALLPDPGDPADRPLLAPHRASRPTSTRRDFDASSTLATWLDGAGYETGLFGKYLNNYPLRPRRRLHPAGLGPLVGVHARRRVLRLRRSISDGTIRALRRRPRATTPRTCSPTRSTSSSPPTPRSRSSPSSRPTAPHAPRTPAPRDRHAFAHTKVKLPANFNRVATDAPRWWAQRPKLDADEQREATRGQWRALQSVDDAVGRFLEDARARGRGRQHASSIYLSDNGYSLGSHRNPWKDCAYEECIHLPLMVRWPGHTDAGGKISALAGSMDIAPTIAAIAGAAAPAAVDGESLVPLLTGEASSLEPPDPPAPRQVPAGCADASGASGPSAGPTSTTRRASASSTTTSPIPTSSTTSRDARRRRRRSTSSRRRWRRCAGLIGRASIPRARVRNTQSMSDSFGARDTLTVSGREYEVFRLDALQEKFDVARLPYSLKVLLENALRLEDGDSVTAADVETIASWDAKRDALGGDPVPARAGADAGLHRRAGDRRPGGDARRDRRAGLRPVEDQPAGPGRPGDRPLGPGRRVRQRPRLRHQRRPRLRAKPRALRLPALGPAGVRQLPRRPAGDRDLPPGQPRVPEPGRLQPRARRRHAGLPRHPRRHRLAHDDGQRPRRARLGRRRDRGRGGDARPADLDAAAAGGRLQARRRAARGRDRHRPRAHRHRDAARARRGLEVRRVLRPRHCTRSGSPTGRRSATCRRSSARPARSSRSTPRRSATSSSPAARPRRSSSSTPTPASRGCSTTRDSEDPTFSEQLELDLSAASSRRSRARSAPRTGSRWRTQSRPSSSRWPSSTPTPPRRSATAATRRSRSRSRPPTRRPRTTMARPASRARSTGARAARALRRSPSTRRAR